MPSQIHEQGQLTEAIEWRFETLNQHSIFISFLEHGQAIKIESRWVDIIAQCLKALKNTLILKDSISAYTTLLVEFSQPIEIQSIILIKTTLSSINLNKAEPLCNEKLVLPVLYDEQVGKDLDFISQQSKLSIEEIIALHSAEEYQVYAVGFSPGFAFMGEVKSALQLPRRSTPRQCVSKGSVAIAENQTAIYPNESPGGWHIIGNCPLRLFKPEAASPNIFKVGQRVSFQPINRTEFQALLKQQKVSKEEIKPLPNAQIKIIKSSALSIIIDKGRQFAQQEGLTESGPMDAHAFYWANHLLENDANASMIEVTMGGLSLTVSCNTVFSLTGADLSAEIECVNGSRKILAPWMCYKLLKNEKLHVNYFKQQGLRAYIAFKGGFEFSHKPLFNSYSTVVREKLGGHKADGSTLDRGDELKIKSGSHLLEKEQYLTATPYRYRKHIDNNSTLTLEVKIAYQTDLFSELALKSFLKQIYEVSTLIDRMAYRLIASEKIAVPEQGIISEGIALGSVQITPDGEPIVLMQDRQTIGGYPKIAVLSEASISDLSQASPGQQIRFVVLDQ